MTSELTRFRARFPLLLGARQSKKFVGRIEIYVPDRDEKGNLINQPKWVRIFTNRLFAMNGGVVNTAPLQSQYYNPTLRKRILEKTIIVYSDIYDVKKANEHSWFLREELHDFGKETNQKEVYLTFNGSPYIIERKYYHRR